MRSCLELHVSNHWSCEEQTRARFYFSKLLRKRGKAEEASKMEQAAREMKDQLIKDNPGFLRDDPSDERLVYDQMVGATYFRLTGKLHGSRPVPTLW
jgi:hypothetical protein